MHRVLTILLLGLVLSGTPGCGPDSSENDSTWLLGAILCNQPSYVRNAAVTANDIRLFSNAGVIAAYQVDYASNRMLPDTVTLAVSDDGVNYSNRSKKGAAYRLRYTFRSDRDFYASDYTGMTHYTNDGGATWSTFPYPNLFGLSLASGNYIWAGFVDADHGLRLDPYNNSRKTLERTTDGGQTWTAAPLAFSLGVWSSVREIFYKSASEVLLVATYGNGSPATTRLFRSIDGGATFAEGPVTESIHSGGIFFLDGSTGWIAGSPLLVTNDGGATWNTRAHNLPVNRIGKIKFLDASLGYAFSAYGLFQTTDGGSTWTEIALPFRSGSLGLDGSFDVDSARMVVSYDGKVYTSTDEFATYTEADPHLTQVKVGEVTGMGNAGCMPFLF